MLEILQNRKLKKKIKRKVTEYMQHTNLIKDKDPECVKNYVSIRKRQEVSEWQNQKTKQVTTLLLIRETQTENHNELSLHLPNRQTLKIGQKQALAKLWNNEKENLSNCW